ncbi:O-antigen ligase family protein [Halobacteriovorax vibrionivorans]|uniref:O-antigen ligase family protein n=1 Tax=Halobacteriovorax vibrionivorans TaxID=2152716 RepID=A0ABY0IPF4_9BACT|nr:O-antigen ligase family protein [Halobacteriovorax vibrionivorans]RZF23062.1 O-antigen ligase family protein [Halobacteriovorax vibrionivorans]
MTETKKANLLAWAIFFYLTMTIFYKAFSTIGMLLFVILAFYVSKDSYKEVFKNKLQIFFSAFIFILILSVLVNGAGSYSKIKYYFIPLIFAGGFYQYGHMLSEKWIKRLIFWTLTLSAFSSFVGVIQVLFHYNIVKFTVDTYGRNQGALMGGAMYYSYPIAMISAMTLAALVHRSKFKSYVDTKVLIITLIINLIGLYYSYTRGAILSFIACLPFIFYYTNKKIFSAGLILGAILAGAVGYVVINQVDLGIYRFKKNNNSDSYRIALFKTALRMYEDKPVLGYGLRNYEAVCPDIQNENDIKPRFCKEHSHNQFLDAMAMTGSIGTIAYVLFFGGWLLTYLLSFRESFLITLPGFATYLSITMTDAPLYIGPVTSILFIMYGMLFIRKKA